MGFLATWNIKQLLTNGDFQMINIFLLWLFCGKNCPQISFKDDVIEKKGLDEQFLSKPESAFPPPPFQPVRRWRGTSALLLSLPVKKSMHGLWFAGFYVVKQNPNRNQDDQCNLLSWLAKFLEGHNRLLMSPPCQPMMRTWLAEFKGWQSKVRFRVGQLCHSKSDRVNFPIHLHCCLKKCRTQ